MRLARAGEHPFGKPEAPGVADAEWCVAYAEGLRAANVDPAIKPYNVWGKLDARARELLAADGVERWQVVEAARRLARNPSASPERLDIELQQVMQKKPMSDWELAQDQIARDTAAARARREMTVIEGASA